ncbi:hypothetical protein BKK54_04755 [Rodentibacter genomosp. 1]|uniref:Uncharacterized protein n=1 Tax=Rodentibacter genomosp. 1 TaxID=1908264 RepID=A0A1V3J6X5_9PAST|nr:hypothetical protein [Rodentibacter genomosp. 1]OOF51007.1 hypothetical protein BKK54_04755 [Rodentibacter genomosp. 1]
MAKTTKSNPSQEKLDWSDYSEREKEALACAMEDKAMAFSALFSLFDTMRETLIPVDTEMKGYDDYLRALVADCHYVEKWLIQSMPARKGVHNVDDALANLSAEEIQQDLMKFTVLGFLRANIALISQEAQIALAQIEKRTASETGGQQWLN